MNEGIVVRAWPGGGVVSVRDATDAGRLTREVSAKVDACWNGMRARNPRLHDGRVLLVDRARLARGEVGCVRGRYRELATAEALGSDQVRALGVCGVVVGRDASGNEHLLFGRRSGQTRIYGGMWENAPSGIVEPEETGQRLGLAELTAALAREGLEELGLEVQRGAARVIATLEDAAARSVDVVVRVDLERVIDPRRIGACAAGKDGRWEYVDAAWVAVREVDAWVHANAAAVSPPTIGLVEWLEGRGWGC